MLVLLEFAHFLPLPPMKIAPIIPIRRSDPFDDPAFLFEPKYDGFRAVVDTVNGRILSKNLNRMRRFERLLGSLPTRLGSPVTGYPCKPDRSEMY